MFFELAISKLLHYINFFLLPLVLASLRFLSYYKNLLLLFMLIAPCFDNRLWSMLALNSISIACRKESFVALSGREFIPLKLPNEMFCIESIIVHRLFLRYRVVLLEKVFEKNDWGTVHKIFIYQVIIFFTLGRYWQWEVNWPKMNN